MYQPQFPLPFLLLPPLPIPPPSTPRSGLGLSFMESAKSGYQKGNISDLLGKLGGRKKEEDGKWELEGSKRPS